MIEGRNYTTDQYDAIVVIIKKLLFISDTDYDTYLDSVTPMILQEAEYYCNRHFSEIDDEDVPSYTMDIPKPVYMYISKRIEQNIQQAGVNSESQGARSIGYGNGTTLEVQYLSKFRKVDWTNVDD